MSTLRENVPSYLFVAGVARSGTTALTTLLNAYPSIIIGQERYFGLANQKNHKQLTPELFGVDRFFSPEPGDNFISINHFENIKYRTWLREKYLQAQIVGDKVPNYFHYFDQIAAQFSGARMLFIVRDPVHVADSWERRKIDPDDTIWKQGCVEAINHWNAAHEIMLHHVKRHPHSVGVVAYEDLFSGDETTLNRLTKWLAVAATDHTYKAYREMTADWPTRQNRPLALNKQDCADVKKAARYDLRDAMLEHAL